jgi:hypothetical protein
MVVDQVMKEMNWWARRWRSTARPFVTRKASSMGSSFITCCVTTTKPLTSSPRLHQVASWYRMGSS